MNSANVTVRTEISSSNGESYAFDMHGTSVAAVTKFAEIEARHIGMTMRGALTVRHTVLQAAYGR
jgi:hypothetical protein